MRTCNIYPDRPQMCKDFPRTSHQIKDFPGCTYYFENGKRKGYCCKCGECCIYMRWPDGRDDICRHVEK